MLTLICKDYAGHHRADGILLEVLDPTPADLLPRLIKRADAAARLAVSERHLDSLVAKAGIRPVEGLPIRYRENDLLRLTLPADEKFPLLRNVVPMPTARPKPTAPAPLPHQKTKFRL